ncbi:MAG: DUF5675 family protein [Desulfobacterales bacterium]|nr:DUF5675 family protein [Desulfobacterales bacterium]
MYETLDIYLTRLCRSDQGTEGRLSIPALNFSCPCLELPWRDNKPNISCIPPGTYPLAWRESRRWKAFHIQNVPGRSFILIHSGNFAGDVAMGWKTHVHGCVLLGTKFGRLKGQRAILVSRPMVRRFNTVLRGRKARITIKEQWREAA